VFKEISTKIRQQKRKRKIISIHAATWSRRRSIQKRLISEMLK
jgi:hypothetical protein